MKNMKVILRDDDTCYFTKPEELEKAFGDIWDFAPISLAVTPFVGTVNKKVIPNNFVFEKNSYPIGENKELVAYLKKLLNERKISITLHGYNHDDIGKDPEFVAGKNLSEKVKEGKEYLEKLFDTKITTFVPPHNSFSKEGWEAVVKNRLNISGITNFRDFSRLKYPYYWKIFIKKCFFKPFTGYTYPYVIDFKDHKEIPYYSLSSRSPFKKPKKALKSVYKKNGVFCIATHYFSLQKKSEKNLFNKLLKEIKSLPNIEFITFNDIK